MTSARPPELQRSRGAPAEAQRRSGAFDAFDAFITMSITTALDEYSVLDHLPSLPSSLSGRVIQFQLVSLESLNCKAQFIRN